jgi:hypothetical protein
MAARTGFRVARARSESSPRPAMTALRVVRPSCTKDHVSLGSSHSGVRPRGQGYGSLGKVWYGELVAF